MVGSPTVSGAEVQPSGRPLTRPFRWFGSSADALPASVVRVSGRHQRSSIPWSRLGDNPGTTSRRSIRPRERQRVSIIAWSRLRSSGCGVNRTPTQDGERRETNLRPRARSSAIIASTHVFRVVGRSSGVPSTCNSARLGICESVGMQRFWVGGKCQPRSVLRRFANRPARSRARARAAWLRR